MTDYIERNKLIADIRKATATYEKHRECSVGETNLILRMSKLILELQGELVDSIDAKNVMLSYLIPLSQAAEFYQSSVVNLHVALSGKELAYAEKQLLMYLYLSKGHIEVAKKYPLRVNDRGEVVERNPAVIPGIDTIL